MVGSDEDRDRSRRLSVEDWGRLSTGQVLGGRTIKRSGDAMCDLHRAQGDVERGFLGLASKPRSTVSPGLASKPVATVSPCLASKLVVTISPGLASKPVAIASQGLASKLVAMVLVIWSQNHSLRFPGLGLKTGGCGVVIWPTKSL
jgi:hypothetical protein